MTTIYRSGAIGAMMDEYEKAVGELMPIIQALSEDEFSQIRDAETEDADCRSVQSIMNHVVRAGYTYANYIREQFNEPTAERIEDHGLSNPQLACEAVEKMMRFTNETLEGRWTMSDEEMAGRKFTSQWGQEYDIEQILEHGIVHILRHRRQIQRLLSRQ
jgi:uncharacterized damage-inducible protein DinB